MTPPRRGFGGGPVETGGGLVLEDIRTWQWQDARYAVSLPDRRPRLWCWELGVLTVRD